jgi:YidC/Oxa1 family membrane protein insertase
LDTTRVLIAVILSLGLIFAYQELVLKRMYPPEAEHARAKPTAMVTPAAAVPSAVVSAAPAASVAAAPSASATAGAAAHAVTAPPTVGALKPAGPPVAARDITVETPLYTAVVSTRGGRLISFLLSKYKETAARNSPLYQMVSPTSSRNLPMELLIAHGGAIANDADLNYSTSAPEKIHVRPGGEAKLELTAKADDGSTITKTIEFKADSYALKMSAEVSGGAAPSGVGLALSQPLTAHEGYRDLPELQADVSSKVLTEEEKGLKKGVAPATGPITYAGFGDRYFLTAYLPENPPSGTLSMAYEGDQALVRIMFEGSSALTTRIYLGPKLLNSLESVNPALNKAINFGWSGILALPFLRVLRVFHYVSPNYGWDIILLTLLVRVLSLPLSVKSQRSMMRMQRLQPQMEKIREKFKDDNERLQREMVDLYKRNHVNPLGGCLPMAVQFPIFIGLYEALLNAVELRHAPFMWWIRDLSAPDCYKLSWMPKLPYMDCHGLPVLVIVMGISTFFQQKMTPTSPDPNQQRMMMLMPIFFTVLFVNFPAGLTLYYFASNVLGIVQQIFLNREFKAYTPSA